YITEGTMAEGMFPRQLQAMGFVGNDFRQLDPDSANYKSLAGNSVKMRCEHERSQDGSKVYDKLEVVTEGGSKPRKNDPNVSKKRQTLFGDSLAKLAPAPEKAPAATQESPAKQDGPKKAP